MSNSSEIAALFGGGAALVLADIKAGLKVATALQIAGHAKAIAALGCIGTSCGMAVAEIGLYFCFVACCKDKYLRCCKGGSVAHNRYNLHNDTNLLGTGGNSNSYGAVTPGQPTMN